MSVPNDPMSEIRASFFMECEELLEALQDGLQLIEENAADDETINVIFRAVHSIKGGAGAFGLDPLVRFAHRFETILDGVRSDRIHVDRNILNLFFRASDHLCDLVRICRDDSALPTERTQELLQALDQLLGEDPRAGDDLDPEIDFQPLEIDLDLDQHEQGVTSDGSDTDLPTMFDLSDLEDLPPLIDGSPPAKPERGMDGATRFIISFKPFASLFETGNDPYILLRNLQDLGTATVECDFRDVPPLDQLTPEIPHLKWSITLDTDADAAEIASVFEFVEGLCALEIGQDSPEAAAPETAMEVSQNVPQESASLGEIVVPQGNPTSNPNQPARPSPPAGSNAMVRVDLDRIERLVNLVGELVINQAMLSQSLQGAGLSPHSDAMNGLEEFQRLTRDIQDSVMMIRAQPVKPLFQRMSRIVREASSAVDKDARLFTEGENTEVDKTVIERLADPLTHIVRNAVDHGLESTQDRIAAGKPPQGKVTLSAAHRSGRVIIEVSDDGGGIIRPKVLQAAIDKGLIPPDTQLSDSEIDNLLFLPGFSTATSVSDLSGRGVGMDVVRTEIQSLGGRVSISSHQGQGTSLLISLPLTLAVLDGMIIDVAQETLVVPLSLVVETLTLTESDVEMLRPGSLMVRVRDGFVPLIDLGSELGYREALGTFDGSVVLLISHEDGHQAALLIDGILDQRQVVIKGLDDSFFRAPGIAAATILGDGRIALIIDPLDIITQALARSPTIRVAPPEGVPA